jgi:hypothetical protein
MNFTLAGVSGLALIVAFAAAIPLMKSGWWQTATTAVIVYWITFLLLRVVLDVPEPLSGDGPAVLSQLSAAYRDGVRTFLSAPGEVLEGLGTFVGGGLDDAGHRYIAALDRGTFAGDPYWTNYPWVHFARVVGRSVAAIVAVYLGKALFGTIWWLVRSPRRPRARPDDHFEA